jgi:hypothetical protein
MGKVLPATRVRRIEFCESHLGVFAERADLIGTTDAAVADLADKTAATRAAYEAARAAQQAARSATLEYHLAAAAMTLAAADIVKLVTAMAATTADAGGGDGVYALASIPAPRSPSPAPPPGKPTAFAAALNADGSVTLRWTCANPRGTSGTLYQVWRRVGAGGPFEHLGATGVKRFTDAMLPAGAGAVTYQIQAVRSTAAGARAQFNVNFGVAGGASAAARLAA